VSGVSGPCRCAEPREEITATGRRTGKCRSCLCQIEPHWTSSDRTFAFFYGELNRVPGVSPNFIRQALEREREGRDHFGLRYLNRDLRNNPAEAMEEAADGGNYCFFEYLAEVREGGSSQPAADLLEAAHHFAKAYAALERVRANRRR
jgi:hypothetical protein